MDYLSKLVLNKDLKRFFILLLLIGIIFAVRSMINLILFTFIISFLMDRFVCVFEKRIPIRRNIMVVFLYVLVIGILVYGISTYLPIIIVEVTQLIRSIMGVYMKPHDNVVFNYIVDIIKHYKISSYLQQGVAFLLKYFSNIGQISLQLFMAIVLSFFYLLEKDKLKLFSQRLKNSKISAIYLEFQYFGERFAGTFGKVIEAQFMIASFNTTLTTLVLYFLGFPQLFGLAIMIFILSLIPVAGVIISFIPLATIAYTLGGISQVITIIILIIVIHAMEAYILNPKLMSSKTDLPVFFTFIVLIFSEHFFGVWGLIVGIPIFIFLLDILEVKNSRPKKSKLKK
ncbi:AI-2E family transporter [Niallia nealsonii]|uniref:AI-2E family transporter n=1 Tax=Niallia nealsonii TaxID=115979 RepID=A0A2N0Z230_9BACI|nr:AI-2E family transporter [Niallia nealsonii]PKG23560.1 AI-2E family transporter [Niallia nealsonii]